MIGTIANLTVEGHADYNPNGYWSPNAFDLTGDKTILKDHGNAPDPGPAMDPLRGHIVDDTAQVKKHRPWKLFPATGDTDNEGL
jgi:hypothetical protein